MTKDKELRRLSKHLYEQDYLDAAEMGRIIRGEGLGEKENKKVRTWDREKDGKPLIAFTEEDENEGSSGGKKIPTKTQCEPKTLEVAEPVVE